MSDLINSRDRLLHEFASPARGFVSIVDEVVAVAAKYPLSLRDSATGPVLTCHSLNSSIEEGFEIPYPKRGLRATLARIAVLCQQLNPDAFLPWGGEGHIPVITKPDILIHAKWKNTGGEYWLELTPVDVELTRRAKSRSLPAAV